MNYFIQKPTLLTLPLSLVKVLTMLVGELDYDNLFQSEDLNDSDDNSTMSNSTTSAFIAATKLGTKHKFAGHVWYVTFVVFVTLVLMNLLVGLAVSDIQVNT